jgi:anti-sigma28 factor (negative regulator of flagellin synthesis)
MKIYDVNVTGASTAGAGRAQETHRAAGEAGMRGAAASASGDHIELSGALSSLGRALTTYRGDRAANVEALAAQYRNGTYQVDSLATSRGMVAGALAQEGR